MSDDIPGFVYAPQKGLTLRWDRRRGRFSRLGIFLALVASAGLWAAIYALIRAIL